MHVANLLGKSEREGEEREGRGRERERDVQSLP